MADLFSLVGKVSVEYAQAESALKKVSNSAEDTAQDIKKAGDSTDTFGTKTQTSGNKAVSAFERIGRAIMNAFSKHNDIDETESSLKDLTSTIDKQETELAQLKTKYADLYVTQGKNSKEAKETAKEIDKLSTELKENKSALQEAEKAADKYDNSLNDVGDSSEGASGRIKGALGKIGGVVAAAFAVDKVVEFGKSVVDASATVAAEQAAFEQVMGDYSDTAQKKINEIADTTGKVSTQLTPYMTSMTAKFKGLGFDIDDATTLASDGLTMAADAAAFWDMSLDDSMSALNSFVNGSYEGGEAIKLFANDTQMASYAVKNGIVSETKEWSNLDEAKKQATRLQYAQDMMAASGATGQAAKEAGQYANVQAELTEKWRQFKAQIGEPLLQNVVIPAMGLASSEVDKLSSGFDFAKSHLSGFFDKLKESETAKSVFETLGTVVDGVQQGWAIIFPALQNLWGTFTQTLQVFWDSIGKPVFDAVKDKVGLLADFFAGVFPSIATIVSTVFQQISSIWTNVLQPVFVLIGTVVQTLSPIFTTVFGIILSVVQMCFNFIAAAWNGVLLPVWNALTVIVGGLVNVFVSVFSVIKNIVLTVWNFIKTHTSSVFNSVKSVVTTIWNSIKTTISNVVNNVKTVVSNVWNAIKSVTSSVFNAVKSVASSVWNGIKSTISSVVEGVKSKVSSVWNSIKSTTSSVFNGIKSTATSVWNSIKSAIEKPINAAKNAVKSAIDKMKGFFNFSWSLPKLKLPHISISGGFSLMPPKAPKFSIKWYKKAMDNAMLLNSPSIFGYDQKAGAFLGGGEAGTEVVSGANTLMGMIRDAVSAENQNISYRFEQLIKLLEAYMPEIIRNMAKNIYLDTGVLVGELGTELDYKLGDISKMRERGM